MSAAASPSELYCLVPPALSDRLPWLREMLTSRGIAVIVDRRDARATRNASARYQRALHLPRTVEGVPDGTRVVQRMPAASARLADYSLLEVIELAVAEDGEACSELVFRLSPRVHTRLLTQDRELHEVEAALGRMLDRLPTFAGSHELDFLDWLDAVVDDR